MAVKTELEILDVRHYNARQLRPLLEQEARQWQQRLRWDYAGATELILQYLDSRILPGFVSLDRGRVCGFAFCVYEGSKAVIGDAFAIENNVMPALDTTRELLRQLLQLLHHSPGIDRVESQLLLYDTGQISPPFDEDRFQSHRRLFMEVDLRPLRARLDPYQPSARPPALPGTLDLQRWTLADYQPAAELIQNAYLHHIDAEINDQYRSLQGSLRFLHNIVRFPGCGVFDARSSWALRDRRTGRLVGILLASRVRPDTAHITQLCIAASHRGSHLGALLLHHAMRDLAAAGFEAITLTVTEANLPAVSLYRRSNFFTRHLFDAHVQENATFSL